MRAHGWPRHPARTHTSPPAGIVATQRSSCADLVQVSLDVDAWDDSVDDAGVIKPRPRHGHATEQDAPFPREPLPRLAAISDQVVLGSDFPHPHVRQLKALEWLVKGSPASTRTECALSAGPGHRLFGS